MEIKNKKKDRKNNIQMYIALLFIVALYVFIIYYNLKNSGEKYPDEKGIQFVKLILQVLSILLFSLIDNLFISKWKLYIFILIHSLYVISEYIDIINLIAFLIIIILYLIVIIIQEEKKQTLIMNTKGKYMYNPKFINLNQVGCINKKRNGHALLINYKKGFSKIIYIEDNFKHLDEEKGIIQCDLISILHSQGIYYGNINKNLTIYFGVVKKGVFYVHSLLTDK